MFLPEGPGGPEPILPIAARLTADALVAGTHTLGAATLRASSDPDYLNAVVESPHLAGSVRWPRVHWERERVARVRVRHVDKALVDALASAPESDGPPSELDPRLLPAIDARVSSLGWGPLTLREAELRARPDPRGLTFELRAAAAGETRLSGTGSWWLVDAVDVDPARPGSHRSELGLVLESEDFGAGLAAVGVPGVVAEGRGATRAALGWSGPLYLPEVARLDGTLSVDVERGRIVPLEPGPARLMGLFALQALPRRFDLDFRDFTADGLAFERVSGDVMLARGIAEIPMVQLTGPVGVVDVSGTSDLIAREYDQRITVLPRISAALPIIGMLSGGASAGIGVLVAGGFLKALGLDLDRIGLRRYAVTGSWDEPRVTPLSGAESAP